MSEDNKVHPRDWRKSVFSQIDSIIESENCLGFRIFGYKYLDIRLIVMFLDCKRVYDWEYLKDKPTVFWTKDYDDDTRDADNILFRDQMKVDVPEELTKTE